MADTSAHTIAVAGATGMLGRDILQILAEQEVPSGSVVALEAPGGAGREVSYGEDDVLKTANWDTFDAASAAVVILACDSRTAAKLAPRLAKGGAVVVDASGALRMEPGVPLVAMDVNADELDDFARKRMVASPTAAALMAATAVAPLYDAFGVTRVVVSTYQSTAGCGREGMDELFRQTRGIYVNQPVHETREVFPKQIAFNVIPQVSTFGDDGATTEEWSIAAEARKMLDPDLRVHANCARIAAFVGQAQYVNIECRRAVSVEAAREAVREAPGLALVDHHVEDGYVTPAETSGEDEVFVSRVRIDHSVEHGLSFWCVADDTRVEARNAVRIAQALIDQHL